MRPDFRFSPTLAPCRAAWAALRYTDRRASASALKLTVGGAVVVMVKASSIMLVTDLAPLQLSAENSLEGTIKHIETGSVNNVVTLSLPGEIELTATITLYSSENLDLHAGQPATAIFNASQVVLGALA